VEIVVITEAVTVGAMEAAMAVTKSRSDN